MIRIGHVDIIVQSGHDSFNQSKRKKKVKLVDTDQIISRLFVCFQ